MTIDQVIKEKILAAVVSHLESKEVEEMIQAAVADKVTDFLGSIDLLSLVKDNFDMKLNHTPGMVESVDTADLKSAAIQRAGSNPATGTNL